MTCERDKSAAFSSNDGFSVVAPTSRIVPSSSMGQKAVLLGLVEAMDLIDKKQRALPVLAPDSRLLKDLFQVGKPR